MNDKPVAELTAPDARGDVFMMFWCPGCKTYHAPRVKGSHPWQWNEDLVRPTIHPSILVTFPFRDEERRCHSFVRDGKIEFLSDCSHSLAGHTVPLEPIDD